MQNAGCLGCLGYIILFFSLYNILWFFDINPKLTFPLMVLYVVLWAIAMFYQDKNKMKIKKSVVKVLSFLFPNMVTNMAYNILTSLQIYKKRAREIEVLNQAKKEVMDFEKFKIQTYLWKGGAEKVLLVHGWEGQAGNFSELIAPLLEANYTIIAFDAPSHGDSSKGRTSLFEFSNLVGILLQKFEISKVVSHSFGGVATTYALKNNPNIRLDRYVLLTTPDSFLQRIEDISEQVGVTKNIRNRLINKIEKQSNIIVKDFSVSEFVKQINVKKALIIHDKNDKIIPIAYAKNVCQNWKNATMQEVENTGHFKILTTKTVIESVVNFLSK